MKEFQLCGLGNAVETIDARDVRIILRNLRDLALHARHSVE